MLLRFASLAVLMSSAIWADAGWAREWTVERVTGTAWTIQSVEARTELKVGMTVPDGVTVATSKSGRIKLSSENNVMTLGPGSVMAVRPKSPRRDETEVIQRVGSIDFDIEKRSKPHFTVETPFMAAVVKGTVFKVDVSKTDTRINVDRGLVQVRDLRSGETAGIGAGQRASVSSTEPGLHTAGVSAPDVTRGKPSAPTVAPIGQPLENFRATQAAQSTTTSRSAEHAHTVGRAASVNQNADEGNGRSFGASGFGGDDGDRSNTIGNGRVGNERANGINEGNVASNNGVGGGLSRDAERPSAERPGSERPSAERPDSQGPGRGGDKPSGDNPGNGHDKSSSDKSDKDKTNNGNNKSDNDNQGKSPEKSDPGSSPDKSDKEKTNNGYNKPDSTNPGLGHDKSEKDKTDNGTDKSDKDNSGNGNDK